MIRMALPGLEADEAELERGVDNLERSLVRDELSVTEAKVLTDTTSFDARNDIDRLVEARVRNGIQKLAQTLSYDRGDSPAILLARGDAQTVESPAPVAGTGEDDAARSDQTAGLGGTVVSEDASAEADESLTGTYLVGFLTQTFGVETVEDLSSSMTLQGGGPSLLLTDAAGAAELERTVESDQLSVLRPGSDEETVEYSDDQSLRVLEVSKTLSAVEEFILGQLPEKRRDGVFARALMGDLTGEILAGKYEIEKRLGAGGFGTVYRARDVRIGKVFAVKVMNPKVLRRANAAEEFLEEAKRYAELDHPRIVRWFAFDETSEGDIKLPMIVMEYLQGRELADILDDQKKAGQQLEVLRGARMLIQVLQALEYAHTSEQGVLLHLDLKPQNVFVLNPRSGEDDEEEPADRPAESIKVIDFGISRFATDDSFSPTAANGSLAAEAGTGTKGDTDAPRSSVRRRIGGTVLYSSPEQCKHLLGLEDAPNLGVTTDLYSFGIMAFQMYAGAFPFPAPRSQREALLNHIDVAPQKLLQARPDLPKPLAELVDRCIQKDPEKRWASAHEARERLEKIVYRLTTPIYKRTGFTAGVLVAVVMALIVKIGLFSDPVYAKVDLAWEEASVTTKAETGFKDPKWRTSGATTILDLARGDSVVVSARKSWDASSVQIVRREQLTGIDASAAGGDVKAKKVDESDIELTIVNGQARIALPTTSTWANEHELELRWDDKTGSSFHSGPFRVRPIAAPVLASGEALTPPLALYVPATDEGTRRIAIDFSSGMTRFKMSQEHVAELYQRQTEPSSRSALREFEAKVAGISAREDGSGTVTVELSRASDLALDPGVWDDIELDLTLQDATRGWLVRTAADLALSTEVLELGAESISLHSRSRDTASNAELVVSSSSLAAPVLPGNVTWKAASRALQGFMTLEGSLDWSWPPVLKLTFETDYRHVVPLDWRYAFASNLQIARLRESEADESLFSPPSSIATSSSGQFSVDIELPRDWEDKQPELVLQIDDTEAVDRDVAPHWAGEKRLFPTLSQPTIRLLLIETSDETGGPAAAVSIEGGGNSGESGLAPTVFVRAGKEHRLLLAHDPETEFQRYWLAKSLSTGEFTPLSFVDPVDDTGQDEASSESVESSATAWSLRDLRMALNASGIRLGTMIAADSIVDLGPITWDTEGLLDVNLDVELRFTGGQSIAPEATRPWSSCTVPVHVVESIDSTLLGLDVLNEELKDLSRSLEEIEYDESGDEDEEVVARLTLPRGSPLAAVSLSLHRGHEHQADESPLRGRRGLVGPGEVTFTRRDLSRLLDQELEDGRYHVDVVGTNYIGLTTEAPRLLLDIARRGPRISSAPANSSILNNVNSRPSVELRVEDPNGLKSVEVTVSVLELDGLTRQEVEQDSTTWSHSFTGEQTSAAVELPIPFEVRHAKRQYVVDIKATDRFDRTSEPLVVSGRVAEAAELYPGHLPEGAGGMKTKMRRFVPTEPYLMAEFDLRRRRDAEIFSAKLGSVRAHYHEGQAFESYREFLKRESPPQVRVPVDPREAHFVEPFYLDCHEVTRAEFREFLEDPGEMGYVLAADLETSPGSSERERNRDWLANELKGEDALPATGMTWREARAYAAYRGKRLPTYLEWEMAVRGVSGKRVFAAEDGMERRNDSFGSPDDEDAQPTDSTVSTVFASVGTDRPQPVVANRRFKVPETVKPHYLAWLSMLLPESAKGVLPENFFHRANPEYFPEVSPEGIHNLCGNVAEWTATPYVRRRDIGTNGAMPWPFENIVNWAANPWDPEYPGPDGSGRAWVVDEVWVVGADYRSRSEEGRWLRGDSRWPEHDFKKSRKVPATYPASERRPMATGSDAGEVPKEEQRGLKIGFRCALDAKEYVLSATSAKEGQSFGPWIPATDSNAEDNAEDQASTGKD